MILKEEFEKLLSEYTGEKVNIIQIREDPKLDYSWVVRLDNDYCFIIIKNMNNKFEVWEEFDLKLEDVQDLNDLKSRSYRFRRSKYRY